MLLREAIAKVLEDGSLTYREITEGSMPCASMCQVMGCWCRRPE